MIGMRVMATSNVSPALPKGTLATVIDVHGEVLLVQHDVVEGVPLLTSTHMSNVAPATYQEVKDYNPNMLVPASLCIGTEHIVIKDITTGLKEGDIVRVSAITLTTIMETDSYTIEDDHFDEFKVSYRFMIEYCRPYFEKDNGLPLGTRVRVSRDILGGSKTIPKGTIATIIEDKGGDELTLGIINGEQEEIVHGIHPNNVKQLGAVDLGEVWSNQLLDPIFKEGKMFRANYDIAAIATLSSKFKPYEVVTIEGIHSISTNAFEDVFIVKHKDGRTTSVDALSLAKSFTVISNEPVERRIPVGGPLQYHPLQNTLPQKQESNVEFVNMELKINGYSFAIVNGQVQLFDQGVELDKLGDYVQALQKFQEIVNKLK